MSSFPLLNLPFIVQRELAKLFDPVEILFISLCSKRAKQLVTVCHDMSRVFDIAVGANGNHTGLGIVFHNNRNVLDLLTVSKLSNDAADGGIRITIDGHSVYARRAVGAYSISSFWEDVSLGVKSSLKHVSDVFHIPEDRRVNLAIIDQKRVLKWVKEEQDPNWKILKLHIQDPNELAPKDLSEVFQYLKISEKISIDSTGFTNANFNYTYPLPKVNSLYINQGSWLTIESLLTLDSDTLRARDSNLSNSDINKFLKHWLNGNLNRLQEILVGLKENSDFAAIFGDVAFVEKPGGVFVKEGSYIFFTTFFQTCRVIQQEDGRKLEVFRTLDPQRRNEIYIRKAVEEDNQQ